MRRPNNSTIRRRKSCSKKLSLQQVCPPISPKSRGGCASTRYLRRLPERPASRAGSSVLPSDTVDLFSRLRMDRTDIQMSGIRTAHGVCGSAQATAGWSMTSRWFDLLPAAPEAAGFSFCYTTAMTREEFERLIEEEFENAIPEKFRPHIKNVAFLVEDEPSAQVRKLEGLHEGETLLGYYHGVPYPERGDFYGMGTTMPDTITLYQKPIEDEAEELLRRQAGERGRSRPLGQALPSFPQPDGSEV